MPPATLFCYSEIFPALRARDISVERAAEVLQEMGVLVDDRRPSFEGWLDRKLDGLADGIGREAESWLRTMRDGAPRSRARSLETVWGHMNNVRPALLDWSQRYDHLREVTRDDIQAILGGLHGTRRSSFLVSLRSLFAYCKKRGMVFRNPASGIKVGQHPYGIAQPLGQDDVDQAAEAAATPSARLVLVLAAVHAARTGAIRAAQLDDVDLGNRRLIIAGRVRPIDEFTHQILLDWLDYRRTRWPDTANPHLLINQQSAMGTGPVSTIYFAKTKLRGQAATLERLRVDRQLEEALAHGPDPLHLAAVFGLDPKTAIRYAENARLLLETAAEQQAARVPSAETVRPAARTPHSLLGMDTSSGEDLVRAGYDALSHHYRGDDDSAEEYGPWLADLQTHLPDRGDVLDIGCGCGLPVARCLAAAGHRVTGVDISDVQIERARTLVPDATFIREDAAQLRFSPGSFDAIICLYALIHMPLDQQPRLLRSIAEWLRPGGWLLATTGQDAWTGTQDNWLGGPATMWWSHADAATYRSWLQQAGLEVTVQQFVPEGNSGHALFWARRPPRPPSSSTEPKGQNHP